MESSIFAKAPKAGQLRDRGRHHLTDRVLLIDHGSTAPASAGAGSGRCACAPRPRSSRRLRLPGRPAAPRSGARPDARPALKDGSGRRRRPGRRRRRKSAMLVTMPLSTSPLLQAGQQAVLLALAPIAHGRALGQDQAIAPPIQFDDLELHRLADQPGPALLGVACRVLLACQRRDSCEAGTKPRTRPTRTITPPRL